MKTGQNGEVIKSKIGQAQVSIGTQVFHSRMYKYWIADLQGNVEQLGSTGCSEQNFGQQLKRKKQSCLQVHEIATKFPPHFWGAHTTASGLWPYTVDHFLSQ